MFSFYLQYFFRKLLTNLFEIKVNKIQIWFADLVYSFSRIFKKINWIKFANVDYTETVFGKFKLRPKTFDVICASPAFERPDMDNTFKILNSLKKENKKVLYLDVGSDFGLYSIAVAGKFENIKVIAFEPFLESFNLLNENIKLNLLENKITTYNFGLYSTNEKQILNLNFENPGSNSIVENNEDGNVEILVKKLDDLSLNLKYDVVFIKMDIEGAEEEALKGMEDTLSKFKEIYIMVEDFVRIEIVKYLESLDFKKVNKLTPYNSFWYKKYE